MEQKLIILKKLREADNPTHPNNIDEGYTVKGVISSMPVVGQRFNVNHLNSFRVFSTSTVQEIIDEKTFRTHNSIYQFEYVPVEIIEEKPY